MGLGSSLGWEAIIHHRGVGSSLYTTWVGSHQSLHGAGKLLFLPGLGSHHSLHGAGKLLILPGLGSPLLNKNLID